MKYSYVHVQCAMCIVYISVSRFSLIKKSACSGSGIWNFFALFTASVYEYFDMFSRFFRISVLKVSKFTYTYYMQSDFLSWNRAWWLSKDMKSYPIFLKMYIYVCEKSKYFIFYAFILTILFWTFGYPLVFISRKYFFPYWEFI